MTIQAIIRFCFILLITNNCLGGILSNIQNTVSNEIGEKNLHIKREVQLEKTEEKQDKTEKPWVPDVKCSMPKIAIAQGHCSLVKEFSLSLSHFESDCHLLYLQIEFISKQTQKRLLLT